MVLVYGFSRKDTLAARVNITTHL